MDFLCGQNSAALFLDPGLGKTSIALEAFSELKRQGLAEHMLVVAPLRVCQLVWPQEGRKWTQFRDLRFSVLHGPKKDARLTDDADVWLINPEGVPWLSDKFFGRSLPWDTVVIDELTKFKNHSAVRSKKLRPRLKQVQRRWGLTGTPAPNGYMDLFGQFLMLDDGAALGKYITHYRDQYFVPDFNGFDYVLQPGGAKRIEDRIRPYVLRMRAEDYLDLPPLIEDRRYIDMEPAARKTYEKMKKDMLAELPDGVVTAANKAAVYSKLSQMANGAVYVGDDKRVAHIHDSKLDALSDLVEELGGQQLLVAYEFQHDLARLQERFGKDVPYIGGGVSEKRAREIEAAWNAGEIPLCFAHPASVGHGLNFQGSGAGHVAWFGLTWDFELFDQFLKRVLRQGTTAKSVINHILLVRNSIDELKLVALCDKDITQSTLLSRLQGILQGDYPAAGLAALETNGDTMVLKLSRQGQAAPVSAPADAEEAPRRVIPKGWGAPVAVVEEDEAPATQVNETEQRQRIREKITAPQPKQIDLEESIEEQAPVATKARGMFSQAVQEQLAGEQQGVVDEPTRAVEGQIATTLKEELPWEQRYEFSGNFTARQLAAIAAVLQST